MNLFENLQKLNEQKEASKDVKNYWVYKEIINADYIIELSDDYVKILFEDKTLYAKFDLRKVEDEGEICYIVKDRGETLNEYFDNDLPESYDEAVKACLYYFWTRY